MVFYHSNRKVTNTASKERSKGVETTQREKGLMLFLLLLGFIDVLARVGKKKNSFKSFH